MKRRTLLRTGTGSLLGTALFGLQACSQSPNTDRQLLLGVTQKPRTLDPRFATDALSSRVNRLLYRQLIGFNAAFEPIADLATWQVITPLIYRFTLQAHPCFHHGFPLTAQDVVATYQSVLDPQTGSPHYGALRGISQVRALSKSEVEFTLSHPDPLFVGRLLLGILPADLLAKGHDFNQRPVGCGPTQFVKASEQKLVLQRTDGVELVFLPVKDATVRVLKLIKGELDWIQNDLSPELAQYCDQHPQLAVQWQTGTSFGYLGFNFTDPLLANPLIRQAIAQGIDRQAIVEAVFKGQARLAEGLLPPEHWAGAQNLPPWEFDPLVARQKLKQGLAQLSKSPGLVNLNAQGELVLNYKTSSDPTRIRLATIYQAQLKKIGIALEVQSFDWGTFYQDIKQGRFQLYSLAWVGIKSPDIFQYVFDSQAVPPKGANRGRYEDTQVDQLIAEAMSHQALPQQAQAYQALQARLQETLAVMPLWYENQFAVTGHSVQGYQLYPDGRLDGLLQMQKSAKRSDSF